MKKQTGRERILTALQRQEPDTVPHMELWLSPVFVDKIVPGGSEEDFVEYLDIDGIAIYELSAQKFETLGESKGIIRDKWGVIRRATAETTPHPLEAPIKSENDLATYVPADPDDQPYLYEHLENMVERFKGQRAIVAIMQEPFGTVNDLRGAANHFMDIVKNPELILRLNDIVVKHHLKLIKNCIDIGADIIAIAGDFAITDGPIVSPKHLEKFAIPPLAELVRFTHSLGVPLIKHTDGNIMPIMELILGTGMDALHPIDPIAGLDIGVVKEKYGDRICLIGNIDCGPLLMWGRKEEVRQAVKETIRKAGRGGGLIAASSHSIQSKVKPENYIEMVKAIREYGRYPLSL